MLVLVSLLTYPSLDSPCLAVAIGAADGGWGLVVMLLLLLLLLKGRTHLDGGSAGGFLHHRAAVLLRTHTRYSIQFNSKAKLNL